MLATPSVAGVVTVKSGVLNPSAVSVNVSVPVMSPSSSAPPPLVSPPNVPASFTCVTVRLISCVSTFPSSSVTLTVKLSPPL